MATQFEERARAVGQDVRELASLHVDLARAEAHEGWSSLVRGLFMVGFGVASGLLVLVALGVAIHRLLEPVLTPAGAAAAVAAVYAVVGAVALRLGWRSMRGSASLLLPRTRAMVWELLACRDRPSDS